MKERWMNKKKNLMFRHNLETNTRYALNEYKQIEWIILGYREGGEINV